MTTQSAAEMWPPRSVRQTRALVRSDLYRYAGSTSLSAFWKHFLFTPAFKYSTWLRWAAWARLSRSTKFTIYPLIKWRLLSNRYKYGIAIPERCKIGPGLFINRFGGIYVHHDVVIGANINITHGTVLGYMNRGKREGSPTLGDRVFLGSGAKIMGRLTIGDDASIGFSAVVTKDVPAKGVAVGFPATVISDAGSEGYINNQATAAMIAATGWTKL